MTSHINQIIQVRILGDTNIEITEPMKVINGITKDLQEEPNEANIEIYNLNEDTRKAIQAAANIVTPIEILVSPLHSNTPVRAFLGEIESASSRTLKPSEPGFVTRIQALAQKRSHRGMYIDEKTYIAGTSQSNIVKDFLKVIGLPYEIDWYWIPTTGILLARSFSGPAFTILKSFVSDFGLSCYIDDGVVKMTSVYEPMSENVVSITEEMLISEPQESVRTDAIDTEMRTITEVSNLFPEKKRKRKKKASTIRKELTEDLLARKVDSEIDGTDYVEVTAVDTQVPGIEVECFAIPNLSPDDLITLDGGNNHFRVYQTELWGDDLRGGERPVTHIRADKYEGGL